MLLGRRQPTPQGLAKDEDEEQEIKALLTIEDDKRGNKASNQNKTTTASRGGGPRMKNLDGARGIGVLTVVLYHMGFSTFKNAW